MTIRARPFGSLGYLILVSLFPSVAACCDFTRIDDDVASGLGWRPGMEVTAVADLVGMVVSDSRAPPTAKYIHLTAKPGFSGPEVLRRVVVPKGTLFVVTGIRRSPSTFCSGTFLTLRYKQPSDDSSLEVRAKVGATGSGPLMTLDPAVLIRSEPHSTSTQ